MDLGDDQELDFIALLSSVGDDDISIEDSTRHDTSMQDLSRQDISVQDTTTQVCSVQDICNDYSKINGTVMTDVMRMVLPDQPGQVVTVRTTEVISTLVQTGFDQLAAANVETGKQLFG